MDNNVSNNQNNQNPVQNANVPNVNNAQNVQNIQSSGVNSTQNQGVNNNANLNQVQNQNQNKTQNKEKKKGGFVSDIKATIREMTYDHNKDDPNKNLIEEEKGPGIFSKMAGGLKNIFSGDKNKEINMVEQNQSLQQNPQNMQTNTNQNIEQQKENNMNINSNTNLNTSNINENNLQNNDNINQPETNLSKGQQDEIMDFIRQIKMDKRAIERAKLLKEDALRGFLDLDDLSYLDLRLLYYELTS